jgi:hypothetical protein
MSEEIKVSIYGSPMPDASYERARNMELVKYMAALIKAEKLNPLYDEEEKYEMLKKISLSDLPWYDREALVKLLEK